MTSKQTFESLYIPIHKQLYHTALMMVGEHAEDALQDAVLLGFEKFGQLREPKHFKTWMTRILMNVCYGLGRKSRPFVSLDDIGEIAVNEAGFDIELLDCIERLDKNHREVVVLKFWSNLSLKEIAQALDVPIGTVKSRLSRAIDQLRESLKGGNAV